MRPDVIGMIPQGIGDFFSTIWWAIMTPLEAIVSGILVFWHYVFGNLLGLGQAPAWILAIVFLTIVIRILLIPIFVKQINSSRNMQLIQPKMRELQAKYKNDRERLGQETMKLYKEEGVNPMASCLPLLLQMPIFFALFQVLNSAAASRDGTGAVGYFLQNNPALVRSLSEARIFGARISDKFMGAENFSSVQIVTVILIILMTATLFFTQKQLMSKNMPPEAMTGPMAQQQKMMLYLFPVIFAIGGINFPVGVLIYWLTSNLWTAAQQYYIIRANPAPGTPAYEAWEERLRKKGKDPKKVAEEKTAKRRNKKAAQSASATSSQEAPRVQRQQPQRTPRSKRQGQGQARKKTAAPGVGSADESTQESPETPSSAAKDVRQQPQRKSRASRQGQVGKKKRS